MVPDIVEGDGFVGRQPHIKYELRDSPGLGEYSIFKINSSLEVKLFSFIFLVVLIFLLLTLCSHKFKHQFDACCVVLI